MSEAFRGARLRELLIGGAHLGALWAFAFAQPLLDLLGKNPDFFVARGNTAGDIVVFALCFTLLPPLLMLAVEAVLSAFTRSGYQALHMVLVALLAAVFFVGIEKRAFTGPTWLIVAGALALGAGIAHLLATTRYVRSVFDVLAFAPLVFLAVFLFFSDTSKLILPQSEASALGVRVPSRTPVVEVIFDEFPTATLLGRDGRIDARRFPHFAALARQATWYPNNTTVADFTGRAVPAIMTGNNPTGTTLPIASDQPNSIFTLLGGAYRLHVRESVTHVCPQSLCGAVRRPSQEDRLKSLASDLRYVEGRIVLPPALANELPNVSTTFGDFGNNADTDEKGAGRYAQDLFALPSPREFPAWLNGIPPTGRTLSLIHMEVPHEPWRFLPGGQTYADRSISDLNTPSAARWAVGPAGIATAEQRHYLQTAYADHLVGLLIRRLKSLGIWKRAMVVVVADHGISFQGKAIYRRIAEPQNLGGVGNPPLFVKYPGQRRGRTSLVHTRTVDLVPTIARQLGITDVYPTAGRPIAEDGRGGEVEVTNGQGETVRVPLSRLLRERRGVLRQARFRLGDGGIFGLGPAPWLLGTAAPALSIGIPPGTSATVESGSEYEDVDPRGGTVPAFVAGELEGVPAGRLIAITVNGTVEATTRSFLDQGGMRYGAVVPPRALQPGRNQIGVYEVGPRGILTPLGGN